MRGGSSVEDLGKLDLSLCVVSTYWVSHWPYRTAHVLIPTSTDLLIAGQLSSLNNQYGASIAVEHERSRLCNVHFSTHSSLAELDAALESGSMRDSLE
jgi:hypothetical protein